MATRRKSGLVDKKGSTTNNEEKGKVVDVSEGESSEVEPIAKTDSKIETDYDCDTGKEKGNGSKSKPILDG